MKKLFSFVLALAAAVAVNATVVTVDFTNAASIGITPAEASKGVDLSSETIKVGAVQVTFKKVNKNNDSRLWTNSNESTELRTYVDNTITITSTEEIRGIEVSGSAVLFKELSATYTWKGNANSVTLTASGSCKVNTITITIGEEPNFWTPDTIQVSDIDALVKAKDNHSHYIIGVVDGDPWINFGTGCMWLHDAKNAKDSVEGFKINNAEDKAFTEEALDAAIGAGDTIMIFANGLAAYHDNATNKDYNETTSGYYVKTIGKNANRKYVTLISGSASYDEEESLMSFEFQSEGENLPLVLQEVEHENALSIAGFYMVTDFTQVTIGNEVLADGKLTLTMTNIDKDGVVSYNVVFASNAYKCTGENIAMGKFSEDNNNINVAKAVQIGNALEKDGKTPKAYNIYGYVAKIDKKTKGWTKEKPTQIFWMTDTKGSTSGDFEVYNGTVNVENAADTIVAGDFVCVNSIITKYVGSYTTIETSGKAIVTKMDPKDAPVITGVTAIEISTTEALAIGNKMKAGTTAEIYSVGGYIVKDPKSEGEGIYTVFMSDNANDTYGEFQGYKCTCTETLAKGDYIRVEGPITRYDGTNDKGSYTNIEVSRGKITRISASAIDAAEAGVKAVKTLSNDQIMIKRNGVTYTIMGTVIR